MFRSSSRTSAKTGVAPAWTMTFAVAGHVIGVVITSSPGPTPSASSARCIAAVPEATAITCSDSRYAALRRSSSSVRGPVVSQPERSVSATAAISSSPTAGGWKPSGRSRRLSIRLRDFAGLRDVEADQARGFVCVPQRVLGRLARCEDRAGAVGPAPQRAEDVAGSPIDADAADPVARERLLQPADTPQLALRRDEEANARALRPPPPARGAGGGGEPPPPPPGGRARAAVARASRRAPRRSRAS